MRDTASVPVKESKATDEYAMDVVVGYVLLIGVLLSMALIAIGLVWRWVNTGQLDFDYTISGVNLFEFVLQDLSLLLQGALRPRLLINLGIATLMLTPYVRVLASMLYFAFAEHNWKYTGFTAFVLVVLTYSLFLR